MRKLRLGTRGSKLALYQAETVAAAARAAAKDIEIEVVTIVTRGDQAQGEKASEIYRDKRDWVQEIEDALLKGQIDFAVHSAKDIPEIIQEGTALLPVLQREAANDVLICRENLTLCGAGLSMLRHGAVIGSSSLRRAAQLSRLRPDLIIEAISGNVPRRVEKLNQHPSMDAIVLAAAGLRRLGMEAVISYTFAIDEMVPAANQGTLAAQFREDDVATAVLLSGLVDGQARDCWLAERSYVSVLGADCNSSVGAHAVIIDSRLTLRGRVLSPDGTKCMDEQISGACGEAAALGATLAEKMLKDGAEELLKP